jgi:hypothetical protein
VVLTDLEAALEPLLSDAIACIKTALTDLKQEPSKVRVDLARWVVEDRRAYRDSSRPGPIAAPADPVDPLDQAMAAMLASLPTGTASLSAEA